MTDICNVWCVSDGKTGHVNQVRGLLAALRQRIQLDCHKIEAVSRWQAGWGYLKSRDIADRVLPPPDLILCAGSKTHLTALAARRARGGRVVVLLRPSLPLAWFDLCIVPTFDDVPASPRVVTTRGPLTEISYSPRTDEQRGLILLGGPSRHHQWSDRLVARQIEKIVSADASVQWNVLTSRRTPRSTERTVADLKWDNVHLLRFDQSPPDALPQLLAQAAQAWITRESVSMTYEALASGAAVGLIDLPQRRANRAFRAVECLVDAQAVTTFSAWQAGRPLVRPAPFANEAEYCADQLLERLPELQRFRFRLTGESVERRKAS